MTNREVQVFPDKAALARAAAMHFAEIARSAIELQGRISVALSGGTTPEPMYRLLATPEFSSQIRWQHVHLFWSDERCVPPDDADSNYNMAWKSFISQIPIPPGNIHRIQGEEAPDIAAESYEQVLKDHFRDGGPRFDLILLGLGEDGHTASIFPGSAAVSETRRLVLAVQHPRTSQWRVTLTLPVINKASHILFLVSGAGKSEALRIALREGREAAEFPINGVAPHSGQMTWFVDRDAVGLPSNTNSGTSPKGGRNLYF